MPYIPDPLDDTKPTGSDLALAAIEFRALKTKLKAHETAVVTTLPNATTAVANDLAALSAAIAVKNRILLTGSGNFTVPAGVTTLWVTARGGATQRCSYTAPSSHGFVLGRVEGFPPLIYKKLAVTPGQVVAYQTGVDEVLGVTPFTTSSTLSATTAATQTSFGAIVAPAAVAHAMLTVTANSDFTANGVNYGTGLTPGTYEYPLPITSYWAAPTYSISTTDGCGAFLQIEY